LGERAATELIERDYARKPLTSEEIETIFGSDEILPFLNSRHAIFKARGFCERAATTGRADRTDQSGAESASPTDSPQGKKLRDRV
jgi:hypothetical protein